MIGPWTPIHEDPELTDQWWADRGFIIGQSVFYNSIRDASGRYNGYCLAGEGEEPVCPKTRAEALIAIQWYKAMHALKTIRQAGYNTTDWANWAQKWAAHGMRPSRWPAPPDDAPTTGE